MRNPRRESENVDTLESGGSLMVGSMSVCES